MMIEAAAALLVLMQQSADPMVAARGALGQCLREYVEASARDGLTAEAFKAGLPEQCGEQEQVMREAIRRRETEYDTSPAEIQQISDEEVEDLRENFRVMFEDRAA